MTKRTTKGVLLVIGALVAAACGPDGVLPSGPDFDAQFAKGGNRADRVDVCHIDDEGNIKKINVNGNALAGHVGHGDGMPDEHGSCDAPAPDPTIEVLTHVFTPFPWGGDGGNLNVSFTSANCDGDVVIYQLVGTFDGLVRGGTIGSGDGPHTINGLIPPVPPDLNTDYMVRGACDNGEAVSTAFAK